ncbi:hypothetical protein BJG92_00730 [Arthrobacter sp. SO5]|nr:hypothetical protein [Arthrobacter sp. SO5]
MPLHAPGSLRNPTLGWAKYWRANLRVKQLHGRIAWYQRRTYQPHTTPGRLPYVPSIGPLC